MLNKIALMEFKKKERLKRVSKDIQAKQRYNQDKMQIIKGKNLKIIYLDKKDHVKVEHERKIKQEENKRFEDYRRQVNELKRHREYQNSNAYNTYQKDRRAMSSHSLNRSREDAFDVGDKSTLNVKF
jgi:hypothetical protein